MRNTTKFMNLLLIFSMLFGFCGYASFANSAEPPSLVILVNNPPDDMSVSMVSGDRHIEAQKRRVAWEGYYVFYSSDTRNASPYVFEVTTGGESFECTYSQSINRYNEVLTLDLNSQTLSYGTYPFRQILLVSLRLIFTLLLEGALFFWFGFREKKSWIGFLLVNLLTQGVLNTWLISGSSIFPGYLIFALVFGEFFVYAAEAVLLPVIVKEKKKRTVVAFVFLANTLSLVLGGYLITALPV